MKSWHIILIIIGALILLYVIGAIVVAKKMTNRVNQQGYQNQILFNQMAQDSQNELNDINSQNEAEFNSIVSNGFKRKK